MGWRNPPVPWSELERRLSDAPLTPGYRAGSFPGDGGDAPAWSRTRKPYEAPDPVEVDAARNQGRVPYAELHCHSNFSFLDGASHPEELVEEAARLGLEALALTDHNGFYGVVRFAEAARVWELRALYGAELTLDGPKAEPGAADPGGRHLVVLARDPQGYAALSRTLSAAQMAGEKGAPRLTFDQIGHHLGRDGPGHLVALTGCRKGTVPQALVDRGPAAARRELQRLVEVFGRDGVRVELWDHGDPLDSARNDGLAQVAALESVDVVATNNVHYAVPARRRLATAMAAVRARRSLDEIDGWLPAAAGAHLRSGTEQFRRFARYPGVVERAAELGRQCAFDLSLVAPELPDFPVPEGHTEMSWLRTITERGATRRYGPRSRRSAAAAWQQIDHELQVIEQLGFPGYFLIVWDLVEFCRRADIFCQGRGSAANSAVCFAIGITKADAVSLGLLFERFLSPERDGPPDIDIDIESGRREEVIQYAYTRYGRLHAAQVANVITYRARSSVRDMAKALGYATGQQDAFAKSLDRWAGLRAMPVPAAASPPTGPTSTPAPEPEAQPQPTGEEPPVPADVLALAREIEHFPRHLGIHSGGMVICDRPVAEVCPVEWGRMEDRSVLQWDKEDCAAAGLVKFDLLGLGMLSALHGAVELVGRHHGVDVDIAEIPQEDVVYDMLCRADSIGVFQVESRAQIATLPRLKPRTFYDLVVEVALIRPGPIQGGSVHPYIRRRNGKEPVTYLHPLLEPSLRKTLGVPLFQEQLMQMAIDVAGFTPAESDELRQAMGSKRSQERMERLRQRLYDGMAANDITGDVADQIFEKLAAFANFGFPESHSVSFAYLVYASSWFKLHYPAAFCASLLNAQPMGFYSPHSLVQDARRHGVVVRTPDLNASAADADLEPVTVEQPVQLPRGTDPTRSSIPQPALRLGIGSVRGIGEDLADTIAQGRPYAGVEDLVRRTGVNQTVLEAMATAGALECFGLDRRRGLWTAGAAARSTPDRLAGIVTGVEAPTLPGMSPQETAVADLWATGVAPDGHPTRFVRPHLDERGVSTVAGLAQLEDRSRVWVGGVVTHRQRPATAAGITFVNLEDETGFVNVVCSVGCWTRYKTVARSAPALLVRGMLERTEDGVINVVADKFEPLPLQAATPSRDFR